MPFDSFILAHESALRLGFFLSALALLAMWELLAPRRAFESSKAARWTNHIALAGLNMFFVRVLLPMAGVGLAAFTAERGAGLLNMLPMPYVLAVVISLLALDLAVYVVHLAFHTSPVLWRMHRVHHADTGFDVTTAVRFHPIQAVLGTLIKLGVILSLGTPVLAVLLFETAFHALLLFNHANVRIRPRVERVLRWLVVTPDMHRVHHSVHMNETNSNYGFALPWWDRLFGTYHPAPLDGHERMLVGIESFRSGRDLRIDRMLLNPFLGQSYSLRRRRLFR